MIGDLMPLYADYLSTQMWIRQQIQKALELKRAREEKQRRKEEREWQRKEKRIDKIMKLTNLLAGYLKAGRGEKV